MVGDIEKMEEIWDDFDNISLSLKKLIEKTYVAGVEYGKQQEKDSASAHEFERGADAAWHAAKEIMVKDDVNGLSDEDLIKIFNTSIPSNIITKYPAPEVIRKIKDFKEYKDSESIEPGDIARQKTTGATIFVTKVNEDAAGFKFIEGIGSSGIVVDGLNIRNFEKIETRGTHSMLQEITSLLDVAQKKFKPAETEDEGYDS